MGEDSENKLKKEIVENEWMIRPCESYDEEYSDCTSIKSRLHQYFIYGKFCDCSSWKHASENCYKWTEKKDVKARSSLIESEKARRLERLKGHFSNDVWTKRKLPPEDWSKSLPESMQKEYETTFLYLKAQEMKDGANENKRPTIFEQKSYCCVM